LDNGSTHFIVATNKMAASEQVWNWVFVIFEIPKAIEQLKLTYSDIVFICICSNYLYRFSFTSRL